jgi:prolyl-tRNA editing enzyme YbaK/EbsC (Cys-tRNA(Pro) deacylase)
VADTWPEPVERVAAFLRQAGAEARLEELEGDAASAADAARATGATPDAIVKSILVICDGRPVLTLLPGDRRADTAKIAAACGTRKARLARADEVVAATGFEPGGVAPFPLAHVETVLVDRTLLAQELVWVGAGSPSHLAALRPTELLRLTEARPVDAVEEPVAPLAHSAPRGVT